jgi:WD40 repeat protein
MHESQDTRLHAMSADGRSLLTGKSGDYVRPGPLHLWDTETGRLRLSVAAGWPGSRDFHFSPDGTLFTAISIDDHLHVWETATGKKIAVFSEFEKDRSGGAPLFHEFSPDGRFLILDGYGPKPKASKTLVFWEVSTRAERARLNGSLWHLQFAADAKEMALAYKVGEKTYRIERWQLDNNFPSAGPTVVREVPAEDVWISPNLQVFASVHRTADPDQGDEIELWEMDNGKEIAKAVHLDRDAYIHKLGFSPNGTFLTADNAQRFSRWDHIDYPPMWDVPSGLQQTRLSSANITFSSDDRWLIKARVRDNIMTRHVEKEQGLWDTTNWQRHGSLWLDGDEEARCLQINGAAFVSADTGWLSYTFNPDNNSVLIAGLAAPRGGGPLSSLLARVLPGIKSGGYVEAARLWDVETAKEIACFENCRWARFSQDGKTLVTVNVDGTIRVWDLPLRKPFFLVLSVSTMLWLSVIVAIQLWLRLTRWWFGRRSKISCEPGA